MVHIRHEAHIVVGEDTAWVVFVHIRHEIHFLIGQDAALVVVFTVHGGGQLVVDDGNLVGDYDVLLVIHDFVGRERGNLN